MPPSRARTHSHHWQEWVQVAPGTFRGARRVRTVVRMKTFLPLFAGLALWFGLAVMVGVTFERAPSATPRLQQPEVGGGALDDALPRDGTCRSTSSCASSSSRWGST